MYVFKFGHLVWDVTYNRENEVSAHFSERVHPSEEWYPLETSEKAIANKKEANDIQVLTEESEEIRDTSIVAT